MKKYFKLALYLFVAITVLLVALAIRDKVIKSRDLKISDVLNTPIPSGFFGDIPLHFAGVGDEEKYLVLTNGSFSRKNEFNKGPEERGGGELNIELSKEDIVYGDLDSDGYREVIFPVTANLSFWHAGDEYDNRDAYSREDQVSLTRIVFLKNNKGKPEYAESFISLPESGNGEDILSYNYHLDGGFVGLILKGKNLHILYGKRNDSYLSHYLYKDGNWIKINSSPYSPDTQLFLPR